ncbi:MAG: hypothetical protein MRERV_8c049 [Mycoplasmataceae bacterium RV_VA103A]|nr:MAG: hypothetical protein MRERV_29c017 [Mycoplasmataceae bacterium RV_VA103A]KLL04965.1 MAG: hypothetical protein MRERV_8c049 [Mycoplasmataceae bacterium RV_VA103A]
MLILEKLRKQQVNKDLNLILTSWNWQGKDFTSAQDFIKKMKPWIDERIKQQAEVKEFLKKWKIKKLSEIKGIEK